MKTLVVAVALVLTGCAAAKPAVRTIIQIAQELCDADLICQAHVVAEHNAAMSRLAASRMGACVADAGN